MLNTMFTVIFLSLISSNVIQHINGFAPNLSQFQLDHLFVSSNSLLGLTEDNDILYPKMQAPLKVMSKSLQLVINELANMITSSLYRWYMGLLLSYKR
jgi:hypothetical protein